MMELEVQTLRIKEILRVKPKLVRSSRGLFSETFNKSEFSAQGIEIDWVQDNHSILREKGVLGGLHYQCEPFAQDKLVRVVRGAIIDFAVDIRKGSPTYGQYVSLELSEANKFQILIPKGFAHGLLTLEPHTEILYKLSAHYSREHDRTIRYDDPQIGIKWPVIGVTPTITEKDRDACLLSEQDPGFTYTP